MIKGAGSHALIGGRSYSVKGWYVCVRSLGGCVGVADCPSFYDAVHTAIGRHEQARREADRDCRLGVAR